MSDSEQASLFTTFSFKNPLQKALDKQGLSRCTPVQASAIPLVLEGKDLLANAETGSGKTAAYLLPLMQKMLVTPAPRSATRVLVLAPTRELARQILKHFEAFAAFSPLKATVIAGGQELKYQKALLRKNPEVVIATPGRLIEHLSHNSIDLTDLETLVLDEADRMLDMGFSDDVLEIVQRSRPERQTLLFSATLEHAHVKRVGETILKAPEKLTINRVRDGHNNITQQVILVDDAAHKERLLTWLLANEEFAQVLVFANTRAKVKELCEFLVRHSLRAGQLHGEMSQDERNGIMTKVRQGHYDILVATDVAARGLDVKAIGVVINYDMPQSGEEYVHRIGRTGRAGEQGTAINFVGPHDWKLLHSIERYLHTTIAQRAVKEHPARSVENRAKIAEQVREPEKKSASPYTAFKKKKAGSGSHGTQSERAGGKPSKPANKAAKSKKPAKKAPVKESSFGDGWAPLRRKKTPDND